MPQLTTKAATQYAINRIGKLEKVVKALSAGQGAIVGAIKGDRATLPRAAKMAAEAVVAPVARTVEAQATAERRVALDARLTERRAALDVRLAGLRKSVLSGLHGVYWNDEYKPANALYMAAIDRADKARNASWKLIDARARKANAAFRKRESSFKSVEEAKRAAAAERRWYDSEIQPKYDRINAASSKAKAEASALFKEVNDAAYARYTEQHNAAKTALDIGEQVFRTWHDSIAGIESWFGSIKDRAAAFHGAREDFADLLKEESEFPVMARMIGSYRAFFAKRFDAANVDTLWGELGGALNDYVGSFGC